jgi:hypothetical protein
LEQHGKILGWLPRATLDSRLSPEAGGRSAPVTADRHQDHRLVSQLTLNTWRDHMILEYEIMKYDGDLGRPNLFVPLTRDVCQDEIGSLLEVFPSQTKRQWFNEEAFWSLLRLRGIECNAPSRLAEAFLVRKILA